MRIDALAQTAPEANAPVMRTAPAPSAAQVKPAASAAVSIPAYEPAADMRNAIVNINRYLRDTDRNVQFDVDESTGKTVVSVVDANTHEVIRQMPSEETLAIARAISRMSGLLLNERA